MNLGVSTKGEYGVRIMVDLARHYGEHPRSLTDISQAEALPLAYLEQLVKMLREAQPPLVISTRGAHGGYRLSQSQQGDTVESVLRYVHFDAAELLTAYRHKIDAAPLDSAHRSAYLDELEEGLRGYTYLEE